MPIDYHWTTLEEEVQEGALLIYKFTPNLEIAGTYHALNRLDKLVLENRIRNSDAVVLEWDMDRDSLSPLDLDVRPFSRPAIKEDRLQVGIFDAAYLFLYHSLMIGNTARLNTEILTDVPGGPRNPYQNEFVFCSRICQWRKKAVYYADIPWLQNMQRMLESPRLLKMKDIYSLATGNGMPEETYERDVLFRNDYMMDFLEGKFGPVSGLDRKVLLVVGLDHAIDFMSYEACASPVQYLVYGEKQKN